MALKTNYPTIKQHCVKNTSISAEVIDEFIIHYTAARENVLKEIDQKLKRHIRAAKELPEAFINFIYTSYIGHRIFRQGGFLNKYLHRPEFQRLPEEQYRFLEFYLQHPWRYSLAEIAARPETEFFEMSDLLTGETYLLFSPSMQLELEDGHPRLWLNLIGYNGHCHQTFGPIVSFNSFDLDDLFFFATELNPAISDENSFAAEMEKNPVPFLLLMNGSRIPLVITRGHEIKICRSDDEAPELHPGKMTEHFSVSWNRNMYRLESKKIGEHPHFGVAYYYENKKELIRTANTLEGFYTLTEELQQYGIELDEEPDILVSIGMLKTAKTVLNKSIELNPYEKLFEQKTDPEQQKNLDKINLFISSMLDPYNAGEEVDLAGHAEQAGLDVETAKQIWESVRKRMDELKRGR